MSMIFRGRDGVYRGPAYAISTITSVLKRVTYHIVNVHAFTTVNVLVAVTSTDAAPNPTDTSTAIFALVIAVGCGESWGDITRDNELE